MPLKFKNFSAQAWDLKRYQPSIFLAGADEYPFAVPAGQGTLITGDPEGRPRVALHCRWRVPSFGEVTLMTGLLAPADTVYNLNLELARQRMAFIEQKSGEWQKKGFKPSLTCCREIERAGAVLAGINDSQTEEVKARWADLSLSVSLPASEQLAAEYAAWGIEQRRAAGDLKGFLLGANFFHYPEYGEKYAAHFTAGLNFATLPFYWAGYEPRPAHYPTRDKVKAAAAWLKSQGITLKGHPLLYASSSPDWVKKEGIGRYRELVKERITRVVTDFKEDIRYWDVINEMQHFNPFSREAGVELTRLCSDTVKQADPAAVRIVNCDDPFGEYMACKPTADSHPIDYFDQLAAAGVDFDVIGIQVYHGAGWTYCRDLFEMSRYFERYGRFGKPVHFSEIGVPSSEAEDPNDMSHFSDEKNCAGGHWKASDAGFWHGPWTQKLQADWGEGFYKIMMGKPFVKAITWWDFTEQGRHFYTHAGLLDADHRPKDLYTRIAALKKDLIDS